MSQSRKTDIICFLKTVDCKFILPLSCLCYSLQGFFPSTTSKQVCIRCLLLLPFILCTLSCWGLTSVVHFSVELKYRKLDFQTSSRQFEQTLDLIWQNCCVEHKFTQGSHTAKINWDGNVLTDSTAKDHFTTSKWRSKTERNKNSSSRQVVKLEVQKHTHTHSGPR